MRRDDRGAVGLELVLVAPVLLLMASFIVGIGRIAEADGRVEAAARDGARAASLARSAAAAGPAARTAAVATLQNDSATCRSPSVAVTAYTAPGPGTPGSVQVSVSCTASLGDIAVPGLPGSKRLTASAVSPLDPFRGS